MLKLQIIFLEGYLFKNKTVKPDKKSTTANIGFAASLAGRCINGHFITINISWAGQTSLGFCL
jgi:hypothetical protein